MAPLPEERAGRVLAIDPGRRRTGLALSDPGRRLATPLATVELPLRKLLAHVRDLIDQHQVREVLIGWPRLRSGEGGEIAALSEKIAARLKRSTAVRVHLWDEALTSWEAGRLAAVRDPAPRAITWPPP